MKGKDDDDETYLTDLVADEIRRLALDYGVDSNTLLFLWDTEDSIDDDHANRIYEAVEISKMPETSFSSSTARADELNQHI